MLTENYARGHNETRGGDGVGDVQVVESAPLLYATVQFAALRLTDGGCELE